MTPLQILAAAIEGRPAPRIPVFCNLFDQGPRALRLPARDYYLSGEHVATAQLRLRARFGHDNVWSLSYVGKEAEFFGCSKILFAEDGPPNVEEWVIQSHRDIEKLVVPDDVTAHPAWTETGRCLRILREEVGETHPICAYITASNTLPALLMGIENWMNLLLSGPVEMRDLLLTKCSDFVQKQFAAYRAAGANVLIYSAPFGSASLLGMKRFRTLALPWMVRDLAPGGTDNVVYYCGMAPFNSVIPDVMNQLGVFMHYVSPLDDLAVARQIIGRQGLTCGVIDDIKMIKWSPQETRNEVRRLCEVGMSGGMEDGMDGGMAGGHFLLGTGLVPLQVPEANIRAMVEAAFEFGSSP